MTAAVPQAIRPCWMCHWYGYMLDRYTATCVNPAGPGCRPDAVHGCSMYRLDPAMDTGEVVPIPPDTLPTSTVGRRVAAERAALEEIYSSIRERKQPWEPRRRIVDRTGTLSETEE